MSGLIQTVVTQGWLWAALLILMLVFAMMTSPSVAVMAAPDPIVLMP